MTDGAPRKAKIGPRREQGGHDSSWLDPPAPSIPETSEQAAVVDSVEAPPHGVLQVANSRLIVVRAVVLAWDLDEIVAQAGFTVHYVELPWTDALLRAVGEQRLNLAIFNAQLVRNYLAEHTSPTVLALGTLGYSMGGRNFCVLAHRRSRWAGLDTASFLADPSGSRIYVGLHSDRYYNLLRALNMSEEELVSREVQCVNISEPTLEVFETDPDALVVGGQNTRFEALLAGDYFELVGYEALDDAARAWFRNSSANALVASMDTVERLGAAGVSLFADLKRRFYANWQDPRHFGRLLHRVIDECDFHRVDPGDRERIARHVLYESYRVGEPVW